MKYIKLFEDFYNDVKENNFYILFDQLVYIDDIDRYGNEYKISYTTKGNKKDIYIGDYKDMISDFINTDQKFEFVKKEIIKSKPLNIKVNLVYYIGNRKEIIKSNIDKKLAYALKNTYQKNPNYKLGKLVIE